MYFYNASGQKVQKVVTENATVTTTDYLGGYQYQNTVLQFFPTAEGYVKNTPVSGTNTYSYVFNYTDHLGNTRLSYTKDTTTGSLKILEENNYYPFGLKHNGYNADNFQPEYKYQYNGKEMQDELQLNLYDFGARNYDPALGRWMNVDPLAEKSRRFNPYTYALNNPIRFIDPDGMEADDIVFRGLDDKELRIKTAGKDKVVNVPFDVGSNKTLDLGIGNVDPNRFAIGYTVQGDAGFGAVAVGGAGVEMSVVQFSDSKYSNYNYVYAGVHENISVGAQASISASVGGSVSIAYNTDTKPINPTSYAGITSSVGVGADAKFAVGGGVSVSTFSGSGKNPGWKGFSIGVNVGVGAGGNLGSVSGTLSKTWLLNDVKPTEQRSLIDVATNRINPVGSAFVTGTLDKIK